MSAELEVTRTVYRVADFLSWQRAGSLNLRPPFQRLSVWTPKAQSYLIDTLLRGYPVPLIFLQDGTDPDTYEPIRQVVDGQQRLRTILGYIDPTCIEDFEEFTISKVHDPELAGCRFKDLSKTQRDQILNFEFSVHVLQSTTTVKTLLEVFARMNSTGTKLNEQELRNGFAGAFRQFAYELSYENLERWLDWGVFSQAQVSRMKEVELTSELVLFLLRGFRNKSQRALDDLYLEFDDDFPFADSTEARFEQVMSKLESVYTKSLDEVYEEDFGESGFATQGWFYVLFAFVHGLMYGQTTVLESPGLKAKRVTTDRLRQHLAGRAAELRSEDLPLDLVKALRGAATDRRSRETRLEFLSTNW